MTFDEFTAFLKNIDAPFEVHRHEPPYMVMAKVLDFAVETIVKRSEALDSEKHRRLEAQIERLRRPLQ